MLKHILNKKLVNTDLLPGAKEIKLFYEGMGMPEPNAEYISAGYSHKIKMMDEFQHGLTISLYNEKKKEKDKIHRNNKDTAITEMLKQNGIGHSVKKNGTHRLSYGKLAVDINKSGELTYFVKTDNGYEKLKMFDMVINYKDDFKKLEKVAEPDNHHQAIRLFTPISKKEKNGVKKLHIHFICRMNIVRNCFPRDLCNLKISIASKTAPHVGKAPEDDRGDHKKNENHHSNVSALISKIF